MFLKLTRYKNEYIFANILKKNEKGGNLIIENIVTLTLNDLVHYKFENIMFVKNHRI